MARYCVINDEQIHGDCRSMVMHTGHELPTVHFAPNETICRQGAPVDGVYCLHCGSVALTKQSDDDRLRCTYVLAPGDLLGIPEIITEGEHTNGAMALEPVSACFIQRDRFLELLRKNPAIMMHALQQVSRRVDQGERWIDREEE